MDAVYAIWKRLSQVRLDGVNYDIGVKEGSDGRVNVSWVCLKCCEQGSPSPASLTLEQAVALAKIGLHAHHALFHRTALEPQAVPCRPDSNCGPVEAVCNAKELRRSAFAHVKEVYEQLCAAHAQLCVCNAGDTVPGVQSGLFPTACGDWNTVAREFQKALSEYVRAIDQDDNELDHREIAQRRPTGK
jgi:hypothetical protein